MKFIYILGSLVFITGLACGVMAAESEQPEPETIIQVQEPEIIYETVEVPKVVTVHDVQVLDRQIETQLTQGEKELIACVVYAEAKWQDQIGKRLVVDTILNRKDNERFPNSINGVVYQDHQFVRAAVYDDACMKAVETEMYERLDYDIYWFSSDGYLPYGTPAYQHGDHYFSWEEL